MKRGEDIALGGRGFPALDKFTQDLMRPKYDNGTLGLGWEEMIYYKIYSNSGRLSARVKFALSKSVPICLHSSLCLHYSLYDKH